MAHIALGLSWLGHHTGVIRGSLVGRAMTLSRRQPPIGTNAVPMPELLRGWRLAGQRLRVGWRAAAIVLVTVPAALVQAVLIQLPGAPKRRFAQVYWVVLCRVMGVRRRVVGQEARREGRPVLFVSNHTSWLDVMTLGGTLEGCFVAKTEVGTWPVVSVIAKLGRTVFISRKAAETGRERDDMRARLEGGNNLILFPEGTSSDGARTLSFRSPFFSVAEGRDGAVRPVIQPVSIVYDRIDGLPVGRAARPISSWYGDMNLGGHFYRLAAYRSLRATVLLHGVIDPANYPSRKELSRAVWAIVAEGAAGLRQNRVPARIATPDSLDSTTGSIATVETGSL